VSSWSNSQCYAGGESLKEWDDPQQKQIIQTVLKHYPEVQAIYIFGTYGTDDQWTDSDVDIALLF
jgi:predicted nucleotidyltransferase